MIVALRRIRLRAGDASNLDDNLRGWELTSWPFFFGVMNAEEGRDQM